MSAITQKKIMSIGMQTTVTYVDDYSFAKIVIVWDRLKRSNTKILTIVQAVFVVMAR